MRGRVDIGAHLTRMRMTGVLALLVTAALTVVAFVLPYRGSLVASPATVTLVAAAASLWVGFSANRDAAGRLAKIRRAFAVHGDEQRLLRDHWLVYIVVLIRLEVMAAGGFVVALWGSGPRIGVWLLVLCGVMIVLTWPTTRKTQLLLGRARALRDDDEPEFS